MATSNLIFIGIKGSVVAIDRATGTQVWSTHLKGTDFVNVVFCNDELYAAARGEIFCVDQGTGSIRWRNPLKGFGFGLMTIAAPGAQESQTTVVQKRRREQEQAAAAATA
jgi:outer membrane protein assembly factor BamB